MPRALFAIVGFAALTTHVVPRSTIAAGRPNIVIILADDMGYGDVGCFNPASRIPTPHIDRLATEGRRFTDAHSADSVCTPSRYGLLTGRYCWRTRLKRTVLFNYEPPLIEPTRTTIASMLQKQGYQTAMIGKWHLGLGFATKPGREVDFDRPMPWHGGPEPDRSISESIDFEAPVTGGPTDLGFDEAFFTAGCSTDQEPFCFVENSRCLDMQGSSYRHPTGSWRSGMTATSWLNETVDVTFTEKAVDFIDRATQPGKPPFFLYLALSAPHSPHLIPSFARGQSQAGVRGDMVWLVDWSVGRVTRALDRAGANENTLIIVTSDNGPLKGSLEPGAPEGTAVISNGHKSAGEWRGYKGQVFEGGHRVPFVARWPSKVPSGSTSQQPICLVDMLATLADVVDAKLPPDCAEDSHNITSAFGASNRNLISRPIIHHSGGGAFALRKDRWKIIFGQGKQRVRPSDTTGYLFDLSADPHETTDLWYQQPGTVREMSASMSAFQSNGRSVAERATPKEKASRDQ